MAEKFINGVNVPELGKAIHGFRAQPELAKFEFRSQTRWQGDAGHSKTTIREFYGAGQENDGRAFSLEADEPTLLLGKDQGPNPVEHLINALGACLTGAMVYHAAARGIEIRSCECELAGEIDIRGFLGIADDVRRGYQRIQVTFHVESDGTSEELDECARYSPVFDVVSRGTEVNLRVEVEGRPQAPEATSGELAGSAPPGG